MCPELMVVYQIPTCSHFFPSLLHFWNQGCLALNLLDSGEKKKKKANATKLVTQPRNRTHEAEAKGQPNIDSVVWLEASVTLEPARVFVPSFKLLSSRKNWPVQKSASGTTVVSQKPREWHFNFTVACDVDSWKITESLSWTIPEMKVYFEQYLWSWMFMNS